MAGKGNYFCPKCYSKSYITVRLEPKGDQYACVKDSSHVFNIDSQGFPKSVK